MSYKNQLQEFLQKWPVYTNYRTGGSDHLPRWESKVNFSFLGEPYEISSSNNEPFFKIVDAQQDAARIALEFLRGPNVPMISSPSSSSSSSSTIVPSFNVSNVSSSSSSSSPSPSSSSPSPTPKTIILWVDEENCPKAYTEAFGTDVDVRLIASRLFSNASIPLPNRTIVPTTRKNGSDVGLTILVTKALLTEPGLHTVDHIILSRDTFAAALVELVKENILNDSPPFRIHHACNEAEVYALLGKLRSRQ